MDPLDINRAAWRKSSHSGGQTQCVELAGLAGHLAVRDSKNPDVGALILTPHHARALLRHVKDSRLG